MEEEAKAEPRSRLTSRVIIDPVTGCWHYTDTLVGNGYDISASKESWSMSTGSRRAWSSTSTSTASCGFFTGATRPDCVNPEHLFIGTPSDNTRDAVSKGRMTVKKLTLDQVIEIKHLLSQGKTQRDIAGRFGVSATAIGQIAKGGTWKQASSSTPLGAEDASSEQDT